MEESERYCLAFILLLHAMNKTTFILVFIIIGLVIYGLCTASDVHSQKEINSLKTEIELMEQRMAQNSMDYDRCSQIQESAHADNIVLQEAVETKKTELAVKVGLIKE